jgi:hypothetical protein
VRPLIQICRGIGIALGIHFMGSGLVKPSSYWHVVAIATGLLFLLPWKILIRTSYWTPLFVALCAAVLTLTLWQARAWPVHVEPKPCAGILWFAAGMAQLGSIWIMKKHPEWNSTACGKPNSRLCAGILLTVTAMGFGLINIFAWGTPLMPWEIHTAFQRYAGMPLPKGSRALAGWSSPIDCFGDGDTAIQVQLPLVSLSAVTNRIATVWSLSGNEMDDRSASNPLSWQSSPSSSMLRLDQHIEGGIVRKARLNASDGILRLEWSTY